MSLDTITKDINNKINDVADKFPIQRFFLCFITIPWEDEFKNTGYSPSSLKNYILGDVILRGLSSILNYIGDKAEIKTFIDAKLKYLPVLIPLESSILSVIYKERTLEAVANKQAYFTTSFLNNGTDGKIKEESGMSLHRDTIKLEYTNNNFFMSMIVNYLNQYFFNKRTQTPYLLEDKDGNFFNIATNFPFGFIVDRFYVSQVCYLMGFQDVPNSSTSDSRQITIEYGYPESIDDKTNKDATVVPTEQETRIAKAKLSGGNIK